MKSKLIAVVVGLVVLVGLAALVPLAAGGTANDIESFQLDGIWVFQQESDDGGEALHTGSAAIVDDCLLVGGAVVVWQPDQKDEFTQVITAVRNGESPSLAVAGAGLSLAEGDVELPSVITDQCQVTEGWFASS